MGLTLCQRIVENSGGLIDVHSDGEDKGATFMFNMKMQLATSAASVNQIEEEIPNNNSSRNLWYEIMKHVILLEVLCHNNNLFYKSKGLDF